MTAPGVVILGIPIPSTSVAFLTVVAAHVLAGLVCVVAGAVAMLSPKRAGRHPTAGTVYYWSLTGVFVSMSILALVRWPADHQLFILGLFSLVAAAAGRLVRRRGGSLRLHLVGMGLSYILLLIAFYIGSRVPPKANQISPAVRMKAVKPRTDYG
jgi:hypothetical protein